MERPAIARIVAVFFIERDLFFVEGGNNRS